MQKKNKKFKNKIIYLNKFMQLLGKIKNLRNGKLIKVQLAYNEAKIETKQVVSKVKTSNYEELYNRLDTKEWINVVYRLVKARERKSDI